MKYYVYRHIRPDINVPFYVGIGTKGGNFKSFKTEYSRAFNFNSRNDYWQKVFVKNNKNIEVEILYETESIEDAGLKEIEFINIYGKRIQGNGCLVNIMDGGQISMHDDETKNKISKSHQGIKNSPEARVKISNALKGRVGPRKGAVLSPETKEKIGSKNKGKKPWAGKRHSQESRSKMSLAQKDRLANSPHSMLGKSHSNEAKKKISTANKGNKYWLGKKHSPESLIKIGLASKGRMLGRKVSEETREKMRIAQRKRFKSDGLQ